jgi:hypothetical protein
MQRNHVSAAVAVAVAYITTPLPGNPTPHLLHQLSRHFHKPRPSVLRFLRLPSNPLTPLPPRHPSRQPCPLQHCPLTPTPTLTLLCLPPVKPTFSSSCAAISTNRAPMSCAFACAVNPLTNTAATAAKASVARGPSLTAVSRPLHTASVTRRRPSLRYSASTSLTIPCRFDSASLYEGV